MPLTPAQIDIVKATVPVLAEHGVAITSRMYSEMLREKPMLNAIFNKANQRDGHQPKALAASLYAYAAHIDDLGKLASMVELITQRHASLHVQPEHYDVVGAYLLAAMRHVLGDALAPDMLEAWSAAYEQLANIMIDQEAKMYLAADGWDDWRSFRVARKEPESDEITSFYLEPVDSVPLPTFLPGQYITIRTTAPNLPYAQPRQYSLSDAPNSGYYRISVKREDTGPGLVSTVLHNQKQIGDLVEVSHPYGDFFLDTQSGDETSPIVLLSAGVGLTCLVSILNSLAQHEQTARPLSWIHGARSNSARAFRPHIKELQSKLPLLRTAFFVSRPDDASYQENDFVGRVDLSRLNPETDLFLYDLRTRYFVCGPVSFMDDITESLCKLGVDDSRVHMERFGTGGVHQRTNS